VSNCLKTQDFTANASTVQRVTNKISYPKLQLLQIQWEEVIKQTSTISQIYKILGEYAANHMADIYQNWLDSPGFQT